MAKKHSKYKNTGILFELLSRQVASEILSERTPIAEKIIREFFNKRTDLNKELTLYQTLINDSFKSEREANEFISAVVSERKKLDNKTIKLEKYNLIKRISESYSIDDFFKSRVNNYKLYASIFKLFEDALGNSVRPADFVSSKFTLVEHICRKAKVNETLKDGILVEYEKMDKDIRLLTYNILIQRFNEKYSVLNERQKKLLSEYINNVTNSSTLKKYLNKEVPRVQTELNDMMIKVDDDIVKIKLQEIQSQLPNYLKGTIVSDRHILVMMRYYELLKKLKDVA